MNDPFHIYRSSAGSGKTYTLAKEYLKLALVQRGAFRNVLGVTFTNKASREMKSRIIRFLRELGEGTNDLLLSQLAEELAWTKDSVRRAASETLTDILHQYGSFSIVTIDSFFHHVVRSFAREMGLQGSFTIDLDGDKVIRSIVGEMLQVVGEEGQKQLREWLMAFAESNVEEGKSWDFKRDMEELAKELLKDEYKTHAKAILHLSNTPGFFGQFKKELDKIKFSFENKVKKKCTEATELMSRLGLDPSEFKGGSRSSPALMFDKVTKEYKLTKAQVKASGNLSAWIKIKDPNEARLTSAYHAGIGRLYEEVAMLLEQEQVHYQSACEGLRFFYTFGVLAVLNQFLQKYRDDHDVMLIADLPDFLRQITRESDTPYIYEKVGTRYHHYLVDEFQDTSAFQWQNFRPLIKNALDSGQFSMVVGDVKQSIYRFRGGDWELLQHRVLEGIAPSQRREILLGTNHRSEGKLVGFNNDFFSKARATGEAHFQYLASELPDAKVAKCLFEEVERAFSSYDDVAQQLPEGKSADNGAVVINFIRSEETEEGEQWQDEAIRRTIAQVEELQRRGYEPSDMAILVRYTWEGKKIAQAFTEYAGSEHADPSLSYEVVSAEALILTSSHLVRFAVAMIRWLHHEADGIALAEWLHEYHVYIRPDTDERTLHYLSDWRKGVSREFVEHKDFLKTLPLYELVEELIRLFQLDTRTAEYTYLQGFQDAVLDFSKTERGDIPSFLEWWEEERKERAIQLADENNAIKILTIHKAKGLEFPVIFLPFLGWLLDHDPRNDTILWCKGAGQPPFDQLPIIPLKYASNLAHTYWALEYYQEQLKVFMDNLNTLYVAFTRPVEVLWAFTKLPSGEGLKDISDLVYSYCLRSSYWDGVTNTLRIGEVKKGKRARREVREQSLRRYHSHSWRDKVSVQMKGLGGATLSHAVWAGIRVHQLLSNVKYHGDIEQFSSAEEYDLLSHVVSHPEAGEWFHPGWKVDTEVAILLPGGDYKRVDRVNRSALETLIIDFKTGLERDTDRQQVQEYVRIFRDMSYKGVRGFLFTFRS